MHVVVICAGLIKIMLCKHVLFAEFSRRNPPKKIQFVHVFGSAFGFGIYVKALIDFKSFYFWFGFDSVSVYM